MNTECQSEAPLTTGVIDRLSHYAYILHQTLPADGKMETLLNIASTICSSV